MLSEGILDTFSVREQTSLVVLPLLEVWVPLRRCCCSCGLLTNSVLRYEDREQHRSALLELKLYRFGCKTASTVDETVRSATNSR